MVICIIAFVVLAIMGIFSAKYRRWAKEASKCFTRSLTLRPCDTGFDEKIKAAITSAIMPRSERLARLTHRHFKAFSWVFMAIFIASTAYSAYTVYNLAVFGTCDPANPQDCIFNPGGDPNKVVCPYQSIDITQSSPTIGNFKEVASATIIGKPIAYFFGTTWCPHCAWERPVFMNVTAKFAGYVDVKKTEIDAEQPPVEMAIFKHYSPQGNIPVVVIGGKYFRVGSGENLGNGGDPVVAETNALTAILCKVSNNPITECDNTAVAALEKSL